MDARSSCDRDAVDDGELAADDEAEGQPRHLQVQAMRKREWE